MYAKKNPSDKDGAAKRKKRPLQKDALKER